MDHPPGSPARGGERKRLAEGLAFTCLVAAAWLGCRSRALLNLIRPAGEDPTAGPLLPAPGIDANAWFEWLDSLEDKGEGREFDTTDSKAEVALPLSDTWCVLGVVLWSHVAVSVKRHLVGGRANGPSHPAFGWVSPHTHYLMKGTPSASPTPHHSPPRSFLPTPPAYLSLGEGAAVGGGVSVVSRLPSSAPPHKASKGGGAGEALLHSLNSVAASLRRQLAEHMKQDVAAGREEGGLGSCLWGGAPVPPLQPGGPASGMNGGDEMGPPPPTPPPPHPPLRCGDEACSAMWQMLVRREAVRGSLSLEGLEVPPLFRLPRGGGGGKTQQGGGEGGQGGRRAGQVRSWLASPVGDGYEVYRLAGELVEAVCVNAVNPRQAVLATNRKVREGKGGAQQKGTWNDCSPQTLPPSGPPVCGPAHPRPLPPL